LGDTGRRSDSRRAADSPRRRGCSTAETSLGEAGPTGTSSEGRSTGRCPPRRSSPPSIAGTRRSRSAESRLPRRRHPVPRREAPTVSSSGQVPVSPSCSQFRPGIPGFKEGILYGGAARANGRAVLSSGEVRRPGAGEENTGRGRSRRGPEAEEVRLEKAWADGDGQGERQETEVSLLNGLLSSSSVYRPPCVEKAR